MTPRRKYCVGDCNYHDYFNSQVGRGLSDITVFQGRPYQRGYGIGSVIKRVGIPLMKFLGRHLLTSGVALGNDLLSRRPIRESIRERGGEVLRRIGEEGGEKLSKLLEQKGGGKLYKRKKPRKQAKKAKLVKRDIFN